MLRDRPLKPPNWMPVTAAAPLSSAEIKAALLSPVGCPQQTVSALRNLLYPSPGTSGSKNALVPETARPGPAEKYRRPAPRTRRKPAASSTRPAAAQKQREPATLPAAQRAVLAVETLNAALQGLCDAVKEEQSVTTIGLAKGLHDISPNAGAAPPRTKSTKRGQQQRQPTVAVPMPREEWLRVLADSGGLALEFLDAHAGRAINAGRLLEATQVFISRLVALRLRDCAEREIAAAGSRLEKARAQGVDMSQWEVMLQSLAKSMARNAKTAYLGSRKCEPEKLRPFPLALQGLFAVLRDPSGVLDHKEVSRCFARALRGLKDELKDVTSFPQSFRDEVDLLRRAGLQYWTKNNAAGRDTPNADIQENFVLCRSASTACVTAFRRILESICMPNYLASKTKDNGSARSLPALAIKAIRTVVEIHKPGLISGSLTWDALHSALQECTALQAQAEEFCRLADQVCPDTQLVFISNLYWHWSTEDPSRAKINNDNIILSQQMSCAVLQGGSQADKHSGLLIAKLHKLSQSLKSTTNSTAAMEVLRQAVVEAVTAWASQPIAHRAGKSPLLTIWTDEASLELGQLLKRWITWALEDREANDSYQIFFDDAELSPALRGLLLEWQLLNATRTLNRDLIRNSCPNMIGDIETLLLQIYDPKTYPLRRLRTLVRLSNLDRAACEVSEGQDYSVIDKWCNDFSLLQCSEDRSLAQYAQHLHASFEVSTAFRHGNPTADILNAALSKWSSLLDEVASGEDLSGRIDDVDMWLSQLQSMSAYFDMQGLQLERVKTLNLSLKALELLAARESAIVMTHLASELLRLGYSSKAGLLLAKSQRKLHEKETSPLDKMQWHLTYAEYLLGLDDTSKCDEHLSKAKLAFEEASLVNSEQTLRSSKQINMSLTLGRSDAFNLSSLRSAHSGCVPEALADAKKSVKLLQRAWTALETQERSSLKSPTRSPHVSNSDVEAIADSLQKVVITAQTTSQDVDQADNTATPGPLFWPLVPKLHKAFLLVSKLYYQSGMYLEADYYVELARKLCFGAGADSLLLRTLVNRGDLAMRSGDLVKGQNYLNDAEVLQKRLEISKGTALHHCSRGYLHHLQLHWQGELEAYDNAEAILNKLTSDEYIREILDDAASSAVMKKTPQSTKSVVSAGKPITKPRMTAKSNPKLGSRQNESRAANICQKISIQDAPRLLRLKNEISRRKAESLLAQGELDAASDIIDCLESPNGSMESAFNYKCTRARQLFLDALQQMGLDPAFSMLNESTLSFPAILQNRRKSSATGNGIAASHVIQPRKNATAHSPKREPTTRKEPKIGVVQSLSLAFEALRDIVSRGSCLNSSPLYAQTCSLFLGISMLASYMQSDPARRIAPALLAHSLEVPRIMAGHRNRVIERQEKLGHNRSDHDAWPELDRVHELSGFGVNEFQHDFVDIIPQDWIAVSLGLSEHQDALYIARYESRRQPFVIRLPLDRQSFSEAEEESFTFEDGKRELIDIIQQSDATVHVGRENPESLNVKGAKTKWWNDREELDNRLQELLVNIENIWLGGFSGIFSHQRRCPELLARFRQTFENILQKHLPSRQNVRKRSSNTRVTLNAHVFDLFVGLMDNAAENADLDEPLTDLLYFVVDILQFHGEPNAYDEIDFDAIIVETQDALQSYREAVLLNSEKNGARHTVLILDKKLPAFPWESLPCLRSKSVSRVLSLVDLRERILAMTSDKILPSHIANQEASPEKGTYILNPSLDLSRTQSRFEGALSSLTKSRKWTSITARPPTEPEFTAALTASPDPRILLYFGHGSGAQYIRSKTIKHLFDPSSDRGCNVALLFGCSSASLREAGECEPYGTPRTYMLAGCPALLGSLWDVTDGDCDAFASGVLERWGLLERGACGAGGGGGTMRRKGKGKLRPHLPEAREANATDAAGQGLNLSEAVARSRGDCYLKYLNGAAMVVYGIPIALSKPTTTL